MSDLIERAEEKAGCRWDDPDNPNALAMLFGAVARELGVSNFDARDNLDFAVGIVLMDEIENGAERKKRDEAILELLNAGFSPDDIGGLLK